MTDAQTLTIPQAAAYVGISPRKAQRDSAASGDFYGAPFVPIKGQRRVSRADLDRLLNRKEVA